MFTDPEWLGIYGDGLELYGLLDNDGKIAGGFYLYRAKLFGMLAHLKNPPFTPHAGLFFSNAAVNKANVRSVNKEAIDAVAAFLKKIPCQVLTIAIPHHITDMQPFIWKGFTVVPNYTYHLDLRLSQEQLLENFATDKRNVISRAEKDGVQVWPCTDLKVVKQLVGLTYQRKDKKLNEKVVERILGGYARNDNSFGYVAGVDGKPSAVAWCTYDKDTCYYLLGGYDPASRHSGAGAAAIWKCIRHAKDLGLQTFDFEGSMLPEVESYFRGFGGTLVPYYTVNRAVWPFNVLLRMVQPARFS